MSFAEELETHFGSRNLYEILDIGKDATQAEIKSAYRKKSLKVHPDRVGEGQKENAKRAFQTLTKVSLLVEIFTSILNCLQVHYILTSESLKELYDETGTLMTDEDSFEAFSSYEEYAEYWRKLFPKVTTQKLNQFFDKYIGSSEEVEDLKRIYCQFDGDLDMIYEHHFAFDDEQRIVDILNELIESEEVPAFDAFCKEPKSKKEKRRKRIEKEMVDAEKEEKKRVKKQKQDNIDGSEDLFAAIRGRSNARFDDMISGLEAKYSNKRTKNRK